jgi:hypothetical protein
VMSEMKTDATPPETDAAAPEAEPAAPTSSDPPASSNEQELDELRRFRVRTVPPDMRRQWMLAETPVVSTLELQDTIPPKRDRAPAPEAIPRPLFNTPRVSSTAPTRRLPHVVARDRRTTTLVVVVTVAVLAVIAFVAPFSRRGAAPEVHPQPDPAPTSLSPPELREPERIIPLVSEQADAPRSAPAVEITTAAPETTPKSQSTKPRDRDRKGQAAGSPSGKISPPTASTQPDIKSPLFGQ